MSSLVSNLRGVCLQKGRVFICRLKKDRLFCGLLVERGLCDIHPDYVDRLLQPRFNSDAISAAAMFKTMAHDIRDIRNILLCNIDEQRAQEISDLITKANNVAESFRELYTSLERQQGFEV